MTVDPARLLQLLEPAVRPGAAQAGQAQQAGRPAFENRSFQELLSDVGQEGGGGTNASQASEGPSPALNSLGGLDRIENAALRAVLAQNRVADATQENAA